MPDNRRAPLLAYVLAVPVLAAVYVSTFGTRIWAALRPAVATFLGATVIGTVYAGEAAKRAPATPLRAAAALGLAVVLVGPGMAPTPTYAGADPAETVIAAARAYLGQPYKLGAEGPRLFDCSGLIFRAFADAGELPRIGGMRLLARGYLRWFVARGLFTKDEDKAQRGDLIIWNEGEHAGIYLGDGKAISALVNPYGVSIHSINGIGQRVTQFLRVNWGGGDDPPDDPGDPGPDDPGDPGDGDPGGGDKPGSGPNPTATPDAEPTPDAGPTPGPTDAPDPDPTTDPGDGTPGDNPGDSPGVQPGTPPDDGVDAGIAGDNTGSSSGAIGPRANAYGPPAAATVPESAPTGSFSAVATGTINMRMSADPQSRIVGWLGRGMKFRVVSRETSAAGYLWYQVETVSGKQGWVFAHWVRPL